MATNFDTIVIGGGHNGLVTAAYLARAGQRYWFWSAAKSSAAPASPRKSGPASRSPRPPTSTACFVRRSSAICELKKHGFAMLPRNPSSFTPFLDGRYLLIGPDPRPEPSRDRQVLDQGRRGPAALRADAGTRRRLHRADADADAARPVVGTALATCGRLCKLGLALPQARATDGSDAIEILTGAARPSSTAGSSRRTQGHAGHRRHHRRLWPRRRCRARPTCCSITSWASATATAASGATSAAAWAASRRPWPRPPAQHGRRDSLQLAEVGP